MLYPAVITRADIAFAVSQLAQYSIHPMPEHQAAADHLLGYLNGTQWLGIYYNAASSNLEAFADVAFGDNHNRKSSQGYVFKLFGGPVLWKSGKQKSVTKSSTEAEVLATSEAGGELINLDRLYKQLGLDLEDALTLLGDNLQAVRLFNAETATLSTRLRHVDIHQMWVRQEV